MKEVWKKVERFEDYEVSNLGRVKSFKFGKQKILKLSLDSAGYYRVNLSIDNKKTGVRVHQLVAIAFLNHKADGNNLVVDHIDNNPLNNRLENLQILTNIENVLKAKTRLENLYEKFLKIYNPNLNISFIAKILGVSRPTVYRYINR